jgi:hypothetical protein
MKCRSFKLIYRITSFEIRMVDLQNRKEEFAMLFHVRLLEEVRLLAAFSVSLVSALDTGAGDI